MRVSVSFDFDHGILALRLVGDYPLSDVRTTLLRALNDSALPPIAGLLIDLRQSDAIATRTLGDLTAMMAFFSHHAPRYGGRIAALASTDIAFGMARMAGVDLGLSGVEHHEFRDAQAALAWLGT